MTPANQPPLPVDEPHDEPALESDPGMGSEYATARSYLARRAAALITNPDGVPEHGSNDSDFAGHEPLAD